MLDSMISGQSQVATALDDLDIGVQFYFNRRADDAPIPHAWMYPGNEGVTALYGWVEDIVYLLMFAHSQAELQDMEKAVSFLDDYPATSHGDALTPRWRLQSKTRLISEEGDVWQNTSLYAVRYGDKRKLIVP